MLQRMKTYSYLIPVGENKIALRKHFGMHHSFSRYWCPILSACQEQIFHWLPLCHSVIAVGNPFILLSHATFLMALLQRLVFSHTFVCVYVCVWAPIHAYIYYSTIFTFTSNNCKRQLVWYSTHICIYFLCKCQLKCLHVKTHLFISKHVPRLTLTSVKLVACRSAICDRSQFHTEQARVYGTTPVAWCAIVATYSCNIRRIAFARVALRKITRQKEEWEMKETHQCIYYIHIYIRI